MSPLKKTFVFAVCMLFSVPLLAGPRWQIEVHYPDQEEKHFSPAGPTFKIPLRKSKWSCLLGEEEKRGGTPALIGRKVYCTKGSDVIGVVSNCDDFRFVAKELVISEAGKIHIISLNCNVPSGI